jgi:hypothetical protein
MMENYSLRDERATSQKVTLKIKKILLVKERQLFNVVSLNPTLPEVCNYLQHLYAQLITQM